MGQPAGKKSEFTWFLLNYAKALSHLSAIKGNQAPGLLPPVSRSHPHPWLGRWGGQDAMEAQRAWRGQGGWDDLPRNRNGAY